MWSLSAIAVATLALLTPRLIGGVDAQAKIQSQLGPLLSSNASIYVSVASQFKHLSARWSVVDAPQINSVVSVATEEDISLTARLPPVQLILVR
jgi:hypothetical protein